MVYVAAEYLGCSPNTVKARIKKSPRLQEVLETQTELVNDLGELRLFEAIERGDPWAIQFVLKTRCKHRGYGEIQEVSISGEVEIAHQIEFVVRSMYTALRDSTYTHETATGAMRLLGVPDGDLAVLEAVCEGVVAPFESDEVELVQRSK